MNTTIRFFHYLTVDAKAAGVYLNRMAEKGWAFGGSFCGVARFRRTDRTDLQYWAEPRMRREKRERADAFAHRKEAYRQLCADAGWDLVEENSTLQIFCSQPGANPAPIQTDGILDFDRNWEGTLKSQQWNGIITGGMWLVTLLDGLLREPHRPLWTLLISPVSMATLALFALLLLWQIGYGGYLFVRRRRMRRVLEWGGEMAVPAPAGARLRGFGDLALLPVLLLMMVLLFVSGPSDNRMLVSDEDWTALATQPVVRAEDLGLGPYSSGYWSEAHTPWLSGVQSTSFSNGTWLRSLYYRSPSPWLAGVIAQNILNGEGKNYYPHLHGAVTLAPAELGFDASWHVTVEGTDCLLLAEGGVVALIEAPVDLTTPAALQSIRARLGLA